MKVDTGAKQLVKLISEVPQLALDRIERGRHFKLFITAPAGKKILTVSISCSDGRALANNRSILKRWAKGE